MYAPERFSHRFGSLVRCSVALTSRATAYRCKATAQSFSQLAVGKHGRGMSVYTYNTLDQSSLRMVARSAVAPISRQPVVENADSFREEKKKDGTCRHTSEKLPVLGLIIFVTPEPGWTAFDSYKAA